MATATMQVDPHDVFLLTLRGVFAILFGFAAVFWPGITTVTLVYLFSAYILINGVVGLVSSLVDFNKSDRSVMGRVLSLVISFVEIGVGIYLLRHATVAFATLILLIGIVLVVRGVLDVIIGLFEKSDAMTRTVLVLVGVITLLAGLIVLRSPVAGGVAFVWVLGLYALISGPMLIALAVTANKELNQ